MNHVNMGRAGLLAALAIGAATWMPTAAHADGTRRAPPPAPARRARPEQQQQREQPPPPPQKEEKAQPSAEELRAQAEKDRIQKERIEQRRKEAQGEHPAPAGQPGARGQVANIEQRREIAKQAAKFESSYRNHVARVNRLIGIYKAKGDEAKVTQLERMREKLDVRRQHAMEGFRRDLGEPGFQKVQGQINSRGGRAPEDKSKPHDGDR
jgi:hypothetical protein